MYLLDRHLRCIILQRLEAMYAGLVNSSEDVDHHVILLHFCGDRHAVGIATLP